MALHRGGCGDVLREGRRGTGTLGRRDRLPCFAGQFRQGAVAEGRSVLRFQGFPPAVLRAKGQNAFIADFGQDVSGMFGLLLGQRAWEEVKFIADDQGTVKEMNVDKFGVFKKTARK